MVPLRRPVRPRPCLRRPAGNHRTPLAQLRRPEGDSAVIREELSRLFTVGERHRRLFARLVLAFGLSIVVFAIGTVLIWVFETGQKGGNIHGFGDAAFFCSVQLLTVSSSMTNPLTTSGRLSMSASRRGPSSSSPQSRAASPRSLAQATRASTPAAPSDLAVVVAVLAAAGAFLCGGAIVTIVGRAGGQAAVRRSR